MNYENIYAQFIEDRKLKETYITGYSEKHHVIPRSVDGVDHKNNIIKLTPEDHYFAHLLLAKIYNTGGLWLAVIMMSGWNKKYLPNSKPRAMYGIARRKFSELYVPQDHQINMGSLLADNANRINGHKKWMENNKQELLDRIKKQYNDPEYYDRWLKSCKESFTPERLKSISNKTSKLWMDGAYDNRPPATKARKKQVSEQFTKLWTESEYRDKSVKIRKERSLDSEWINKMKVVNTEINNRPEVKTKHSKSSKKMWERDGHKENHARKLKSNARRDYSINWYHKEHGVVFGWAGDMSAKYGGCQPSWTAVKNGRSKSIKGFVPYSTVW